MFAFEWREFSPSLRGKFSSVGKIISPQTPPIDKREIGDAAIPGECRIHTSPSIASLSSPSFSCIYHVSSETKFLYIVLSWLVLLHTWHHSFLWLQPLDRDEPGGLAKWRLQVTASDGEFEAHTEVVVNLKDVNDNAPRFLQDKVTASVPENSPAGELVKFFRSFPDFSSTDS